MRSSDPYGGRFSTERLVAAAGILRSNGWSEERIRRRVYAPFIVAGPASWSDSWGAPRFGPGPIVRTHEGQDVLCIYGARLLAPGAGIVEYDTSLLGGRVARLHRSHGGYWYFAHLSAWNEDAYPSGTRVHRGDVIGFCGDTGNATTPHVHFGHYDADGDAIDPMSSLVSWLRQAEGDLDRLLPDDSGALLEPIPDPVDITASAGLWLASGGREASGPLPPRAPAPDGTVGAFELTLVWSAGLAFAMVRSAAGRAKRRAPRRRRVAGRIGALRQAPAVVVHALGRAASM